jgi:Glycosyl hydrolase family 12
MPNRCTIIPTIIGAVAAATCLLAAQAAIASPVAKPAVRVHDGVGRLCGNRDWKYADHGQYVVRNDVFQPHVQQCVWNPDDRTEFRVVASQRESCWILATTEPGHRPHPRRTCDYLVGSYPDVQAGCNMWGVCSKDPVFPIELRDIRAEYVTVSTRFRRNNGREQGNDAADDFFTSSTHTAKCPAAEVMVWLRWQNIRVKTLAKIRADGMEWYFDGWISGGHDDGTSCHWNYLQFRPVHQRSDLWRFNVLTLFRYAQRHGLLKPGWRQIGAEWGFECWHLCIGDQVTSYSVHVVAARRLAAVTPSNPGAGIPLAAVR